MDGAGREAGAFLPLAAPGILGRPASFCGIYVRGHCFLSRCLRSETNFHFYLQKTTQTPWDGRSPAPSLCGTVSEEGEQEGPLGPVEGGGDPEVQREGVTLAGWPRTVPAAKGARGVRRIRELPLTPEGARSGSDVPTPELG